MLNLNVYNWYILLDKEACFTESPKHQSKENTVWVDNKGLVCVEWETGEHVDKYPSVWLRDNCQCTECFDSSSRQRKLLLRHLDAEILPANTSFDHESNEVLRLVNLLYQWY